MEVNKQLTPKQKRVLDFILHFVDSHGYSPSLEEIASYFKLHSLSTVHQFVDALQGKGYLTRIKSQQRSIEPITNEVEIPLVGYIAVGESVESILVPQSVKIPKNLLYKARLHNGDVVIFRRPEPSKNGQKIVGIIDEAKFTQTINTVIEDDCLNAMRVFPDKSIDMILCDLPYGTTQNQWDSVIPLDQLWRHYERIIKDDGAIVLTAQGLFSAKLMLSNPKLFKYKITWVKSKPTNFLNAKKQPLRKHEDVLIFYKKQPSYNPQMTIGEPYNKGYRKNQLTGSYGDFGVVEVKSDGQRYPTDVIYFKTAESEGPVYHPTQKPVALGRYLIRTFSKPGDIVLDNTCGSGSFLVSAIMEGRKFIGIEKNQEVYMFKSKKVDYIEVCEQRIRVAQRQYELDLNGLKPF